MQEYTVNENGEKVLLGTRRPDGTFRKERRIRAGYIPQDEQPVYESRGMMARANIPKCPGLDPGQASGAAAAAARSKAAKKNEKRKAKKTQPAAETSSASSSSSAAPAAVAAPPSPSPAAPSTIPQASSAPAADGAAVLDKQIKALSKKVRQCQALLDRAADGDALSQQEQEKVDKMSSWQEEIKQLEHQLARLSA